MSVLERMVAAVVESPYVQAPLFGIVFAALRVCYDGKETKWQRMSLEILISGCFCVMGVAAVRASGIDGYWAIFIAGGIGALGVEQTRALGRYLVKRKIDQMTGGDSNEQT